MALLSHRTYAKLMIRIYPSELKMLGRWVVLRMEMQELGVGQLIKIKDFPKGHRVKLFRLVVSTRRTDFVLTNDLTQNSSSDADTVCAWRWKIEQFHREAKQLTGIERCQCRKARIQRNHIACAFLVSTRLAQVAKKTGKTLYRIKHGLLDDYLRSQLKAPEISMTFA